MKKIKVGVWVLFWVAVVVFVGAALLQNYDYLFQSKRTMMLFFKKTPELPTILFYLLTFFTGLMVAGLLALYKFYYINKSIKVYKATLQSQSEEIEALKNEIISLGGSLSKTDEPGPGDGSDKGNGSTEKGSGAGGGDMHLDAHSTSKNNLTV